MTDLVQFLRERLDEDEAVARAAALQIAERAVAPAYAAENVDRAGQWVVSPWLYSGRVEPDMGLSGPDRVEIATVANDHISRHDPARVLREVGVKRQIVDSYALTLQLRDAAATRIQAAGDTPDADDLDTWDRAQSEAAILRDPVALLARPFSDHPDYREEWRP